LSSITTRVPELAPFFEADLIDDVLQELKSGKEATAYWCAATERAGIEYAVAKVYRPMESRGFRNDAVYQQGRFDLEKRVQRAVASKSSFGREVQFGSWIHHEYATLALLHGAGCDVPQPVSKAESALLIEFVGDADGPAPQLKDVRLSRDEARAAWERLLLNIEVWLALDRVHGDLSAYNVLYWDGQAVVIDFPQAVDPHINRNAYELLERDLTNLYRFFERSGVRADPRRIAGGLWTAYQFGELPKRLDRF
jgi:RIO kinase 1